MQTCADELAPIFSTLPVLLENLRAAHYQLGVDSYLRVERLLLQLAAQGQLSLEPAQLKTQLLAVLRPLLCHSPLEQQQFTQHFEHWWQLVHAFPVSNPSVSLETAKPKSRNKQHFLTLILLVGLLCSISSDQYLRPPEIQTTLQPPIEPIPPEIPPFHPVQNTKLPEPVDKPQPPQNKQTEIPPQAVKPLAVLPQQSVNKPSNIKPEDINESPSILLILSILFISLSSLLLYLIRIRQKTQQFLNRYAVTEALTTQTLFVSQLQKQLFHTLELGQLAQRLRIRETLASTDLNISATIAKTLQAGNYFLPVYAERKRTPEYLILVDKQSFSDHHAALVDSLVARLQSEGVEITRYYFHGNPELCYQNSYQGVKLARLFALHGESRLLIFSDGAGLLDVMGELHPWLKDLLSWQVHCVLTLHDLRGWAAQALLRANFWVLPASESGLRGLVSLLHPQSTTTRLQWDGSPMPRYLEEHPLRWLTREKPSVAEERELLQQLRKFLGKEGFEWLCACAVWHEVRWQMTLFFGYQLFGQDTAAISARLPLLARLARLVWFKTGFMPDWLRRSLLAKLSLAQKKLLRNSLFTLFGSAALEPISVDSMPIKIAQQPSVKKWKQATENQLNDVVFLEFSLVSSLAVPVPKMVGALLGREAGTRHMLWLTLGLIGFVVYQVLELSKTEPVVSPPVYIQKKPPNEGNRGFTSSSPIWGSTYPPYTDQTFGKKPPLPNPFWQNMFPIEPLPPFEPYIPSRVAFAPGVVSIPEMIPISAGIFQMGSKEGFSDEKPEHSVSVDGFYMSRYEITRGHFANFVRDTNYVTDAEKSDGCSGWTGKKWERKKEFNWRNLGFEQNDTHPVVCVSWEDAMAYSKWLSKKTGKIYSLPTEAQWEYAARAGTSSNWYWENSPVNVCDYANVFDNTARQKINASGEALCEDRYVFTAPVGKKQSNGFGLFDMSGNVWEWTCSEKGNYIDGKEAICNITTGTRNKVFRGGSYLDKVYDVRTAIRRGLSSRERKATLGFRLVSPSGKKLK